MQEYKVNEILRARIWQDNVESSAWDQIKNMCGHPYIEEPIAIMPDVHAGVGATIGSVLPVEDAVIPSAVGVDIGCGMYSFKTDLKDIKDLDKIVRSIKRSVPLGFSWREAKNMQVVYDNLEDSLKRILTELKEYKNTFAQLGTLGGGNHFIELQKDEEGFIWVMIHSGSRNFGKLIADQYCKKAKELSQLNIPKDLEILEKGTDEFNDYITLMNVAVQFAAANRRIIGEAVKREMKHYLGTFMVTRTIHVPHNYAMDCGGFILHRKGATSANRDEVGIIPGSMGSPSYIVKGLGNPLSYNSCSHGAGRIMSRGKAKKEITLEQFKEIMGDVASEDIDVNHLDEAPQAYKNIDEIMEKQKDLVEIEVKLSPIANIKG